MPQCVSRLFLLGERWEKRRILCALDTTTGTTTKDWQVIYRSHNLLLLVYSGLPLSCYYYFFGCGMALTLAQMPPEDDGLLMEFRALAL